MSLRRALLFLLGALLSHRPECTRAVTISIPQTLYSRPQERVRSFAEPGVGPAIEEIEEQGPEIQDIRHFHLVESLQPARDARQHKPPPAQ